MRKRKLLAFGLAFCLGLSGVWNFSKPVFAAEAQSESQVQSENTSGEDHITSMDEEGNIKDADSSAKLIENPAGPNKSRSGEPQVVNLPMGHMVQMQCILALPMENTNLCFPVWLAG